jgi:N-formylmaleamate deformylase
MQSHWTEGNVVVDGTSIHYYRTGQADKPPLVLLHGFSDNGLCWLPVALELEADYDVILPDAVGHGKSQRVQPGQPVDQPAHAAGVIRELGLDRPVLGGHSMGGSVAARTAARFPGLVRALILEDPAWFDAPPAPPPAEETEEGEDEKPSTRRDKFDEFMMSLPAKTVENVMEEGRRQNPNWPEIEMRPWAESKMQFDINFTKAPDNNERSWPEVMDYIDVPTLLLTAGPEQYAIITAEMSQRLAEKYSNIHVAHIANAGHSIRRDNFTDYMTAVRDFLRSLDG